ncbi:EamA family transporter [Crystallibacter degradans]|uniref:EamA family transporter n=1 Tax=Crystallibacter degradans TaxID=2726743 RepID=UPI001F0E982C|nr:EamA family transporter [Arthrobacter sp. SF27]
MTTALRISGTTSGTAMAFAAMCCVQIGLAVSVGLVDRLGAGGVAWLRLAWAAVILVAIARPWRIRFSATALRTCVLLGVATAGMTILFMAAAERLPLGTAVALEFLGPLGVALVRGRGVSRLWALVAGAGVVALTEPWHGQTDGVGVLFALGAALCWAAYILLTQRAGDAAEGLGALAVSMPVAALVATFTVGPEAFAHLDWRLLLVGVGLALLLPVVPFSLELLALRRLTAAAFGTLMCLEPAIGMIVGLAFLGQVPSPFAILGIALVIAAGIGATRTGNRPPVTTSPETLPIT